MNADATNAKATLARDAERVERAALADIHAAATPAVRESLGLHHETVSDVLVSVAARDPSILLNRALGLDVDAADAAGTIRRIADTYRRHGVARYFLHVHGPVEADPAGNVLAGAGLRRHRGWMAFVRDLDDLPPAIETPFRIERIGPGHGSDYGRIAAAGFDLTDRAVPLVAALAARPDWHLFMTFDGDRPVGGGALFRHGEYGWFDFGATHPDYRGRGSQTALLAHRIRAAAALGCRRLFTETGEAVPGDPQHSYRNILRAGFREVALRDNYVPAA